MVTVEKVHHVRKHRSGGVVEKPGKRLKGIAGKIPQDPGDTKAVVISGIGSEPPKKRKICILAAAVHPHAL